MDKDIQDYVSERLEKLNSKPLVMQYRDLIVMEQAYDTMKEDNKLIDTAKGTYKPNKYHFELVIKLGNDSAILKDVSPDPSFMKAIYTFILNGKRSGAYYDTVDFAILGYLEHKNLGSNSQFAEFASKMLGVNNEIKD